jgi:hypothetical protein
MKKVLSICLAAFVLLLASCEGAYYVTDQPVEPVYVHPGAPGPGYIWIDGEWGWSGGRYVYRNGYWAHPRPGYSWHRGYWDHGARGYRWHRGGWGR